MSLDRFMRKRASLGTILPVAMGPTFGGIAGRAIGARYKQPDLGAALGAMTGGIGGGLIKEQVEEAAKAAPAIPPGAPYALDASSADIPAWALQGAQLLNPAMKQAAHAQEPWWDVPAQEIPGFPVAQSLLHGPGHGPAQAAKTFGGMALGGGGGALIGKGVGMGLEHLLKMPSSNKVPLTGLSLSDLLAGLGGTVGATHGMRIARP